MNAIYTLKYPFKSRRDGRDVEITELAIPSAVTVSMFRKAGPTGNQLLWAHQFTEVCAGLNAIDASKLMTPDALGYVEELLPLITPFDEVTVAIPEIKPVKSVIAKITANPNDTAEFAAQILAASGFKREELDNMDVRQFLPMLPQILEAMSDPK